MVRYDDGRHWLLEAAIAAHDVARAAYDDAFKAEVALREAHLDMVDKVMGIVRAAFPRERDVQDVIFPVFADEGAKRAPGQVDEIESAPMSVSTA